MHDKPTLVRAVNSKNLSTDFKNANARSNPNSDIQADATELPTLTQIGPLKNRQLQLIVMAELKPPPELIKGEREKCK